MANNTNSKPHDVDYINDIPGLDDDHEILAKQIVDDCPDYSDTPNEVNNDDPFKESFYQTGAPVYAYRDLLKGFRKNVKLKDFWFDVNTFENLIDCYTPFETVPLILRSNKAELDVFCMKVYGFKYAETYDILIGITDTFMRKSIKGHSNSGNPTAMKIAAEHFMNLKDAQQAEAINITINNDLKKDDNDGGFRV